ncbi:MAG TPA: ribonuclease P protein component 4 [archaeon]|nr:ribonuclease P protein component 4 [archaeon]
MERGKKPVKYLKIAKERIEILLDLAEKEFSKHPERSRRCIELARKIGLRYNIRLAKEQKRGFCKNCNSLLVPGKTSQVRINSNRKILTVKCLVCNKISRYPYKRKRI